LKLTKYTEEFNFEVYIIFPTFEINRDTQTIDKSKQKTTFFNIPLKFLLTTKDNYFILELACFFGIGLKIQTFNLEN